MLSHCPPYIIKFLSLGCYFLSILSPVQFFADRKMQPYKGLHEIFSQLNTASSLSASKIAVDVIYIKELLLWFKLLEITALCTKKEC